MTLQTNVLGDVYDDELAPCFLTTPGDWCYNRVRCRWFSLQSLIDLAARNGHDWAPNEFGVPPEAWQRTCHFSVGWAVNPNAPGAGNPSTPPPSPVKGPFSSGTLTYWVDTGSCTVGFELDGDEDEDAWHDGAEVCAAGLEPRQLRHISKTLSRLGCSPLPCDPKDMPSGKKTEKKTKKEADDEDGVDTSSP